MEEKTFLNSNQQELGLDFLQKTNGGTTKLSEQLKGHGLVK